MSEYFDYVRATEQRQQQNTMCFTFDNLSMGTLNSATGSITIEWIISLKDQNDKEIIFVVQEVFNTRLHLVHKINNSLKNKCYIVNNDTKLILKTGADNLKLHNLYIEPNNVFNLTIPFKQKKHLIVFSTFAIKEMLEKML